MSVHRPQSPGRLGLVLTRQDSWNSEASTIWRTQSRSPASQVGASQGLYYTSPPIQECSAIRGYGCVCKVWWPGVHMSSHALGTPIWTCCPYPRVLSGISSITAFLKPSQHSPQFRNQQRRSPCSMRSWSSDTHSREPSLTQSLHGLSHRQPVLYAQLVVEHFLLRVTRVQCRKQNKTKQNHTERNKNHS